MTMKGNYLKTSHRLDIKFIDSTTNEQLFEVKNQTWMNIGEFFTDTYVNQLIKQTIDENDLPEDVLVLIACNFKLR